MEKVMMMKRLLLLSVQYGFFVFFLSGCMMAMHGMDHRPALQKKQPGRTEVKEFAEKGVTLSFDVPPLSMGEEVTLALRVSRTQSGVPISGAKVSFFVEQIKQSGGEHAGYDTGTAVERRAEEITGKGVYQLKYRFEEYGRYRITARVWIGEGDGTEQPLTMTFTQDIIRHEDHGAKKSLTRWGSVIGGICMVIMMLAIAI
jgi:hypothetical protein